MGSKFYRIAGNFRGSKYSWFSNISQFVVYIFMVAACTAGKGIGKVASFVGKTSFVGKRFVVQCSTTKTTNILPHEKLHAIRGNCLENLGIEF